MSTNAESEKWSKGSLQVTMVRVLFVAIRFCQRNGEKMVNARWKETETNSARWLCCECVERRLCGGKLR